MLSPQNGFCLISWQNGFACWPLLSIYWLWCVNTPTERGEGPPGPPEEDLIEMKESTSWRKLGRRDLFWTSAIFAWQKNLLAVFCCSGFSFFPSPRLWNFPIYGKHRALLRFSGQQEICDHLRWNHCDFSLVLFVMHATYRECITCTLELKDEVQGTVLDLSACNSD